MGIPFLVEKRGEGFCAFAGSPFDISVEALSAEAAVAALKSKIQHRLEHGAMIFEHVITSQSSAIQHPSLHEHPWFDAWLAEVEAVRHEREIADTSDPVDE
jgi:hypothetical protein